MYIDNLISPSYFENAFKSTFGKITYLLEQCGIYFAVFLFLKTVSDGAIYFYRAYSLRQVTGGVIGFSKIMLSVTYNLFYATVMNTIFAKESENENRDDDDNANNGDKPSAPKPFYPALPPRDTGNSPQYSHTYEPMRNAPVAPN
jgi:hypothetical protein